MTGIFDEITGRSVSKEDNISVQHESQFGADQTKATFTEKSDDESVSLESNDNGQAPDVSRTNTRLREASQELLRYGLLEEVQKPNLYRVAITNLECLNSILEPLDFSAHVDEIRGLIFLAVRKSTDRDEFDEWSHPLVRKQRLTLEQSLLVAILRQYFIAYEQESGTGASQSVVAIDELIPQLQIYLGDTGSEAKERNRILQLLDQLKGHGLVSSPDAHDRVTIRPMIAHLANPENLQVLLNTLRRYAQESFSPEDGGGK